MLKTSLLNRKKIFSSFCSVYDFSNYFSLSFINLSMNSDNNKQQNISNSLLLSSSATITPQKHQQQNTLLPNLSFSFILSFVKHQYHAKIDDQIDKALASMTQGLINKLVSVLEATLGKLGRYDEGSLIGSLLSFTVSFIKLSCWHFNNNFNLILERVWFRQGVGCGLRELCAQQHRSDSKQNQRWPLDFELLRAVVHETNNNFVHVAVGEIGPLTSHVPMHMFSACCEGMNSDTNIAQNIQKHFQFIFSENLFRLWVARRDGRQT